MSVHAVARRYAAALVQLASEQRVLDTVARDLASFANTLESAPALEAALTNPSFTGTERQRVLGTVLGKLGAHPVTRSFLILLDANNRMPAFRAIQAAVQERDDERSGRVRATVTSAARLDPGTVNTLKTQVANLTGKPTVIIEEQVDKALIGGIVTRVGDTVFDGSIRTQLDRLRALLASQGASAEA